MFAIGRRVECCVILASLTLLPSPLLGATRQQALEEGIERLAAAKSSAASAASQVIALYPNTSPERVRCETKYGVAKADYDAILAKIIIQIDDGNKHPPNLNYRKAEDDLNGFISETQEDINNFMRKNPSSQY